GLSSGGCEHCRSTDDSCDAPAGFNPHGSAHAAREAKHMMERADLGLLLDVGGTALKGVLSVALAVLALAMLVAIAGPITALRALDTPAPVIRPDIRFGAPAAPRRTMPPPLIGAVEMARRYLGVPYVFGGTNPAVGLDCSGLVQLVYRQVGIPLPRTAQLQYEATPRVSQADLQPGDLVFFARTYTDP